MNRLLSLLRNAWATRRPVVIAAAAGLAAVVVVVTVIAVAAGSPAQSRKPASAPATQQTVASATAAAVETPTPTPTPVDQMIGEDWTPIDRILVSSNEIGSPGGIGPGNAITIADTSQMLDIYVPGTGQQQINVDTPFAGKQVDSASVTVAGDNSQLLVVVASIRIPSQGLNPASAEDEIATFDLATGQPVYSGTVSTTTNPDAKIGGVSGSHADAVVFSDWNGIIAVNPRTGATIWKHPDGYVVAQTAGSVAVETQTSGYDWSERQCDIETGIATATGATLWSVDSRTVPHTEGSCSALKVNAITSPGTDNNAMIQVVSESGTGTTTDQTFDAETGGPRTLTDEKSYDPVTGDVFYDPAVITNDYNPGPLVVNDTHTGKTIYQIDQTKAKSLNLSVQALYDGYLYTKTTDGTPVIDVTTGQTVADNVTRYPEAAVGDWTYYSDGTLSMNPRLIG